MLHFCVLGLDNAFEREDKVEEGSTEEEEEAAETEEAAEIEAETPGKEEKGEEMFLLPFIVTDLIDIKSSHCFNFLYISLLFLSCLSLINLFVRCKD